MGIKTIFQNAREMLRAQVEARLGAVIIAGTTAIALSALGGAATFGHAFAQKQAISLVKPVTDSITTRQDSTDSKVRAIQDSIAALAAVQVKLAEAQEEAKSLNEVIIAAQRQADPRFDQALMEMARAGEMATQKEKENRELMKRLAKKSKSKTQ